MQHQQVTPIKTATPTKAAAPQYVRFQTSRKTRDICTLFSSHAS